MNDEDHEAILYAYVARMSVNEIIAIAAQANRCIYEQLNGNARSQLEQDYVLGDRVRNAINAMTYYDKALIELTVRRHHLVH